MTFAELEAEVERQMLPFHQLNSAAIAMKGNADNIAEWSRRACVAIKSLNTSEARSAAESVRESLDVFNERLVALQAAIREVQKHDLIAGGGS